ncbi:MAG TPA: type I DNA topoisomerase [Acidimicrobiales bacterium]|nr:type I DNA topoisomerase [Acidimicrobiales bacterium]
MPKPLVIVESPSKARTIAGILGNDFIVESSVGHIRDLPRSAKEIPEAYKKEKWSRDGVDVENDFKPLYVVPEQKKSVVRELKALVKDASEIYLATDEDREGEAISWHLLETLSPRVPVKRMVFHEITRAAIEEAVAHPRDLDMAMVDAQETRRILDRLYGWRLIEVLRRKGPGGATAGRVQSPAIRLLVERERARMAFRSANYWDIEAVFRKDDAAFKAGLLSVDGRRLADGKDFDATTGRLTADRLLLDEVSARALADRLYGVPVTVRSVEDKPYKSSPKPPFITSTLQQAGNNQLGMTAQRTMRAAQSLYEAGFITYMRTDSTTLSEQAISAARRTATDLFGADYVPDAPRQYTKKVKNAQEAHEAIRPAGETFRHPDEVRGQVDADQARVYELIWKRTVASQMADARGHTVSVRLQAVTGQGEDCEFSASGRIITFPGHRAVYVEHAEPADGDDEERVLPPLAEGDTVSGESYLPQGHDTKPPARFTEASLIRELEERGIGRPSTYASIINTILSESKGFAFKKGNALVPTWAAFAVVQILEQHFGQYVDYQFTADMEEDLDKIAARQEERVPWLNNFYFGDGAGLKPMVDSAMDDIDAAAVNSIKLGETDDGKPVVVRVGKYGPYLQVGEENGPSIPPDLPPDELTVERALELFRAPSADRELGTDPGSGLVVFAKNGKYGPYVQLGEIEVDAKGKAKNKPKTASLFSTMTLERITLDDALQLLSLPREVGVDPADGEMITAQNGRYGPYLTKGNDSRSLENEEQIFSITLDQAIAIYAQPKQWGRRGAPKPPLATFGNDPISGRPMVVKDGRFGPYVTDGETNATIPAGVAIETLTEERAIELLAEKRAKGPAPKKAAAKKTAAQKKAPRKAPAKRASAKK